MIAGNPRSNTWCVALLITWFGGTSSDTVSNSQNWTKYADTEFISPRVTNGDVVTSTTAFSSFVYFPGISCGGVLISSNLVLTAGHCVNGAGLGTLYAAAGTLNNPKNDPNDLDPWQQRKAVRAQVHPRFDSMSINFDVAVVEVCPPFDLGQDVNVIRHFARTLHNVKPDSGVVVGYGVTSMLSVLDKPDPTKTFPNSMKLRQARQRLRGPWTCKRLYENYVNKNWGEQEKVRRDARFIFPEQGTQICGLPFKKRQSQCKGDSGGPLYCEKRGHISLCGLVSFGAACGDNGIPGIYTSFYRDDIYYWIREQQRHSSHRINSCRKFPT